MMSNLDQIVKGAPAPGTQVTNPSTSPIISTSSNLSTLPDPLASLPSSPPQIYLNLLILEASLRAQWLALRTRRRQHTFFLTLLSGWTLFFGYLVLLRPREDGSGVGGSVYWAVEMMQKVAFGSGLITGILFYATGAWERGIRWPRRWYAHANKGLRGFSCKIVVIKRPRYREILGMLSFVFSSSLFSSPGTISSTYRFVNQGLLAESEKENRKGAHHILPDIHEDECGEGFEEDLALGGDYIKLLLLPKPFSPAFRENWEVYRTEYWEKENERRAVLKKKIQARDRNLAKEQGGWLWWTGYRGFKRASTPDLEKTNVRRSGTHGRESRVRSGSVKNPSTSRNSSRSVTPVEGEDGAAKGGHVRSGSTASNASERRRRKTGSMRVQKLTPGSRSATPDVPSPLVRENSFTSIDSMDTSVERPSTPGDGGSVKSMKSSVKGSPKKIGSGRDSKADVDE